MPHALCNADFTHLLSNRKETLILNGYHMIIYTYQNKLQNIK